MKAKKQQGVSLIEVLVAVAVLAIGLLGLAALQAVSLKNNNSALMRTHAVYLAYDIIDRIRANPNGSYDVALNDDPPNATNCAQAAANCSSSTMAQFDLAQWKCAIGSYDNDSVCTNLGVVGYLPLGVGAVDVNGSVYTVTIEWVDDRLGNTTTYTMSMEL